jgi:TRAP-type C4-dicarboxylate transport system substrate-binding protein
VQDYLSLSSHVYTPITLVMNGARWDELADEHKAAVERAARAAVEHSRAYGANNDATLLEELGQSMEVNEIDLEAFQEAARPIWDEIAPIAGEEFTKQVVDAAS